MGIKIGLFGFGRTGRVVAEEVICNPHYNLAWVIRKSNKHVGEYASDFWGNKSKQGKIYSGQSLNFNNFLKDNHIDVIIDFSTAESISRYRAAAQRQIKIVSAISNYTPQEIKEIERMSRGTAILYSPNITLGINFLIVASQILRKIAPNADVEIIEEHFRGKKSVSGTALRVAELLKLNKDQHINSIRVGGTVGRHEVVFGFPNQTIRMVHESISRVAFAKGALYAVRWLKNKQKGLYTMEKIISADFLRHSKRLIRDL